MVLEAVSPRSVSRPLGFWAVLVAGCLLANAGCVDKDMFLRRDAVLVQEPVCQVVATWSSTVAEAQDPVNGGKTIHGIAGRVYLFGNEIGTPLVGDGSMVVDLYNVTGGAKAEIPLEEWRFDADTLKRLQRRDAIGVGYTIFLPWGTYKPEIQRVDLRVRYVNPKGTPLYAEPVVMTLRTEINSN